MFHWQYKGARSQLVQNLARLHVVLRRYAHVYVWLLQHAGPTGVCTLCFTACTSSEILARPSVPRLDEGLQVHLQPSHEQQQQDSWGCGLRARTLVVTVNVGDSRYSRVCSVALLSGD